MIKQKKLSRIEELAAEVRTFVALGDNGLDPNDYRVEDGELRLAYGRKLVGEAVPFLVVHGRAVRAIDASECGGTLLIAAIEDGERENDAHAEACEAAVLEEAAAAPAPDHESALADFSFDGRLQVDVVAPEVDAEVLRLAAAVEAKLDVLHAARARLDAAEAEAFERDVENVRAALATARAGRALAPGRRFCADDHRQLRVAFGDASNDLRGALAKLAIATRS